MACTSLSRLSEPPPPLPWATWHRRLVCCRSWAISLSVVAFCFSSSLVRSVMASSPDWFRISAVLRKRRWRADVLSGAGWYGLWVEEEEGDDEEGGEDEDDEGESEEEGGEGVWELETEGELTLSQPELCLQWRGLCWVVEEAWVGWGRWEEREKDLWPPLVLCWDWGWALPSFGACCGLRIWLVVDTTSLFSSSVHTLLLWLWPSLPPSFGPSTHTVDLLSWLSFLGWGAMRG